jgi:hypothetical protein
MRRTVRGRSRMAACCCCIAEHVLRCDQNVDIIQFVTFRWVHQRTPPSSARNTGDGATSATSVNTVYRLTYTSSGRNCVTPADIKSGLPYIIARGCTTTPTTVVRAQIQRTAVTLPTPWYHTPAWVRFSDRIARGARFGVRKPGCRIHRVYRQVRFTARTRVGTCS